ncbi:hypothetical protein SDC9_129864 [bioreactor metagenome]|uniref:PPM-type phosphatase domain-containing protein n=1 Tax=bioreactor metagenome TaxID=1076179 RepID=A0A645D243_9ZZZZ
MTDYLTEWQSSGTNDCHYWERLKLIDMLDEALVFIDADTNKIVYMNKKACQLYEYNDSEALLLSLGDILCDPEHIAANQLNMLRAGNLKKSNYLTMHRKKNGQMLNVEVSAQFMRLHGTDTYVVVIRDMTADLLLKADVLRAKKIQRRLLPADIDNDVTIMKSIYEPHGHISGDLYGYIWQNGGTRLFGYIIDVMGHGIATALQAATVRLLFEQAAHLDVELNFKMAWLNENASPYFVEDSFAAVICFEIDFITHTLTCCAGGINHFIMLHDDRQHVMTVPGLYLGLMENATFDICRIQFNRGDSFFFLSDGFTEYLPEKSETIRSDFKTEYNRLLKLASGPHRDDATAMCFRIK